MEHTGKNSLQDLSSIGREIGTGRLRSVATAVRAVIALAAVFGASSAMAQGGICLSDCGDSYPGGWDIYGGGGAGGGTGGIGGGDPCGWGGCGGGDGPPDQGGGYGPDLMPVGGVVHSVDNNQYSQNPATCQSTPDERMTHASQDIALYYSEHQFSVRIGHIMEVEYDDGSKERYILTSRPNSTMGEIWLERVPGSMSGCSTGA